MLLPSLYRSGDSERTWNVTRAGCYGAATGALAALFRTLGPLHANAAPNLVGNLTEIALAALGFASLFAVAAALRNHIVRCLVRYES
jgi:hypothetical protein